MSAEQNMALVRRLFEEVLNRGNLDIADELLAADFVDHDILPGEEVGVEGFKRVVAEQRALSSDLHFSIEEQIADGDKVVTRVIRSGAHDQKEFRGIAPTGRRITIETVTINRVVEGKNCGSAAHSEHRRLVGATSRTREDRARAHRAGA